MVFRKLLIVLLLLPFAAMAQMNYGSHLVAVFVRGQNVANAADSALLAHRIASARPVRAGATALPTPQITPDKTSYCVDETAILSSGVPASPSYTIAWYINGSLVSTGNGLPTLSTTTPGNYTVTITSTQDGSTETSAPFQLSFVQAPVFKTQFPPLYTNCGAAELEVSGTTPEGAKQQFRWYTNGVLNGDVTNTFVATQSGTYYVEISSCEGQWVASDPTTLTVINLPTPIMTVAKTSYCSGEDAVLTENLPTDPSYTITWYNNGVALAANNNQSSITTNVSGAYTVAAVSNQQDSDGSICSQGSATQTITFNPTPALSVAVIPENSFCEGQMAELVASFDSGSLLWSTGETTSSIKVSQSGTYSVSVTSAAGCVNDTSFAVNFLPNPVFAVGDTSFCVYTQGSVILTAPSGFAAYSWNGVKGSQTYTVTQPGTVSLDITDADGCSVTQQIKVADICADVHIPNTITPNGDGVNDTWFIEGLDESATVKVFTRWGKQVFNSVGYPSPWNGEYGNKKLPQGVYYYVITAKDNTQHYSGSLTIIY